MPETRHHHHHHQHHHGRPIVQMWRPRRLLRLEPWPSAAAGTHTQAFPKGGLAAPPGPAVTLGGSWGGLAAGRDGVPGPRARTAAQRDLSHGTSPHPLSPGRPGTPRPHRDRSALPSGLCCRSRSRRGPPGPQLRHRPPLLPRLAVAATSLHSLVPCPLPGSFPRCQASRWGWVPLMLRSPEHPGVPSTC